MQIQFVSFSCQRLQSNCTYVLSLLILYFKNVLIFTVNSCYKLLSFNISMLKRINKVPMSRWAHGDETLNI